VHCEVGPLTSVARLLKLLQRLAALQHSAEYAVSGCEQRRLTMKAEE